MIRAVVEQPRLLTTRGPGGFLRQQRGEQGRGVSQGDLTTVPPAFIYIPPRTIGFSVAKKW